MILEVWVEERVLDYSLTREVLARSKVPVKVFTSPEEVEFPLARRPELVSWGKKRLFLTKYLGKFFRGCPGTRRYLCCGYHIFHFAEGCPLDCTYCVLQVYFTRVGLWLWANLWEDGLPRLKEALSAARDAGRLLRIGTGEFADSLALEEFCGVAQRLVEFWRKEDPFAVLELKSKVAPSRAFFEELPSTKKVIFSWSVNARSFVESEERGTARLEERLEAAAEAVKRGFSVSFHFDPVILYPEDLEGYRETVRLIFEAVPEDRIAWISLGTLRFPRELKELALERFPETKIYAGEFVEGLDGKLRYFRPLREACYREIYGEIRKYAKGVCVYLCMESEEVWRNSFGFSPNDYGGLSAMLDAAAKEVCMK